MTESLKSGSTGLRSWQQQTLNAALLLGNLKQNVPAYNVHSRTDPLAKGSLTA